MKNKNWKIRANENTNKQQFSYKLS